MTEPQWPNDALKRHLSGPGPKRILSLDGGGVRGVVTIAVLEKIEAILAEQSGGGAFRLSNYFDLIAGTSTGSIIGALLALGKSVSEIKEHYFGMAPKIFARSQAVGARKPKFHAAAFEALLEETFGGKTLGGADLQTGLLICTKRMDTGGQWALFNDPRARYHAPKDHETFPNRDYPLKMIIRASTAAPYFFDPVRITIVDHPLFDRKSGMFVDGGVGGDNNPSLQAFKTATLAGYNINWPVGADNILLISVGTGWRRPVIDIKRLSAMWNWEKAKEALAGLVQETVQQNIVTLQALAAVRKPWFINSELEGMENMRWVEPPLLTFQRFDARLDDVHVMAALGLQGMDERRVARFTKGLLQVDNASADNLRLLYELGRQAGRDIETEDFPDAFRLRSDPETNTVVEGAGFN